MRSFWRVAPLFLLLPVFFALGGCSLDTPINVKYKWNLKVQEMRWYTEETEPVGKRRVKVTMTPLYPKDASVAVALIFKEDLEEAKAAMKKGEEPPKHLASHLGGGKVEFDFLLDKDGNKRPIVLDKGKSFAVIVRNGPDEAAEIELKIEAR
jgi:hypothetical protein